MKVDFTKFPLFTGIDRQDMVIADIRKDIADGIYRNVPGLPAHVLAEKIYRNELVELADDEIHILDLYTSASVGQLADSWQDYKKNNLETGKFSYISKFHILISYKLTIYIVMCFYQGTN